MSPFQGSIDSDKDSPNKSPSFTQQQLPPKTAHSSSFNPNAPTFVPMGIQNPGIPNVSFVQYTLLVCILGFVFNMLASNLKLTRTILREVFLICSLVFNKLVSLLLACFCFFVCLCHAV